MAHTIKIILLGFALLAACLIAGRLVGGPGGSVTIARSALVFIALWLVAAGLNMWIGVSKAGYSVKEEIPFFFAVFLIPAAIAVLVWWRYART